MWLTFLIVFALITGMLLIPGGFMLLAAGKRLKTALVFAPAVSIILFCAEAVLFSMMSIPASPVLLLAPLLIIAAGVGVARAVLGRPHRRDADLCSRQVRQLGDRSTHEAAWLGLYVLIGIASTLFVFIKNLDGADSMFQAIDNYMHIGLVRSFLDTGDLSFLHVSLYQDLGAAGISSVQSKMGGFYPAAWHIVVTLAVMVTNAPVTLAVNAMNAVVIAIVWPLASYYLLKQLFHASSAYLVAGALATMCISASPWDFVIFGPLYPNNLSNVLVPLICGSFIVMVRRVERDGFCSGVSPTAMFVISSVGVALAHPSGIFMAALFLAPFCIATALRIATERLGAADPRRFIAPAIVAAAVLAIWALCYKSPFFAATVSFNWPARLSKHQAFIDVVTLGMSGHSAQPLVAVLVWLGCIKLLSTKGKRWLVAPFLLTGFIYIVDTSTEGTLKHVLAGFWYTDPHRISAMVGVFAVPLAAVGIATAFRAALAWLDRRSSFVREHRAASRALAAIVLFVLVFFPSYKLRGYGEVFTGFGYVSSEVAVQNAVGSAKFLSKTEEDFCKRVLEELPAGTLILNSPNDGSVYLYGLYGANIYYRDFLADKAGETQESTLIREHLDEVATNEEVRDAVRAIGARYLLVLDLKDQEDPTRSYSISYFPEDWKGIDAVNDDTPGFTPILSEGDMRLYRIDVE